MGRKKKENSKVDLEKESNNLIIIVILSLCLICSLGYIAYDKYFSDFDSKEEEKTEMNTKIITIEDE